MLKVLYSLKNIMSLARGNTSRAARMLDVNRGTLIKDLKMNPEDAYIVMENGDVYKRTGKQFMFE